MSPIHAKLLWCGLSVGTRRSYGPARRSYERYCTFEFPGQQAWPATLGKLCGWVCARVIGSHGETRIKPKTISHYLSALRSVHVDKRLTTTVFTNEHLKRLLDGAKRLDDGSKLRIRRPITLPILEKIVKPAPPPSTSLSTTQLDALRVDTAFKVAFAGFLRMGEFTYTKAELKDRVTFQRERLLLADVEVKPSHAVLTLKRSKASQFQSVFIRMARTGSSTCPVTALEALQRHDTRPNTLPLFMLSSGSFSRTELLNILNTRLRATSLWEEGYTGHSFRKGAAQTALDRGLSKEDIQLLGRWSSDAVERYYKHAAENIIRLSQKLLSNT